MISRPNFVLIGVSTVPVDTASRRAEAAVLAGGGELSPALCAVTRNTHAPMLRVTTDMSIRWASMPGTSPAWHGADRPLGGPSHSRPRRRMRKQSVGIPAVQLRKHGDLPRAQLIGDSDCMA